MSLKNSFALLAFSFLLFHSNAQAQLINYFFLYQTHSDSVRIVVDMESYIDYNYTVDYDSGNIEILCCGGFSNEFNSFFDATFPIETGIEEYNLSMRMFAESSQDCSYDDSFLIEEISISINTNDLNQDYLGISDNLSSEMYPYFSLSQISPDDVLVEVSSINYMHFNSEPQIEVDNELNEITLSLCYALDEDTSPDPHFANFQIPVEEEVSTYTLMVEFYEYDMNDGCSYADSSLINFIPIPFNNPITTSIESNHLNGSDLFELYLNPANDLLNIKRNTSVPSELTILNNLGQTISTHLLISPESKIDCSGLTPGVYYIQIGSQSVQKLLISSN